MTYDDFVKLMPDIPAIIAIIGTSLAAFLTYKLNASKNDKSDLVKRIEDAYVLFNQWFRLSSSGIMPWANFRPDGITYDQANDMFIESAKKAPDGLYPRLKFSVLVLFPELIALLEEVKQFNEDMLKEIGRAKRLYKETGDYTGFQNIDWMGYAKKMDAMQSRIDKEFVSVVKGRKLS